MRKMWSELYIFWRTLFIAKEGKNSNEDDEVEIEEGKDDYNYNNEEDNEDECQNGLDNLKNYEDEYKSDKNGYENKDIV